MMKYIFVIILLDINLQILTPNYVIQIQLDE